MFFKIQGMISYGQKLQILRATMPIAWLFIVLILFESFLPFSMAYWWNHGALFMWLKEMKAINAHDIIGKLRAIERQNNNCQ